jgi:hypothetical protein
MRTDIFTDTRLVLLYEGTSKSSMGTHTQLLLPPTSSEHSWLLHVLSTLKAMQYDVPSAFLNAFLDRTLYVRTPDGFQDKYSQILQLLRALYGLKEAPRLWATHFQELLQNLGLHPVQGFPCLWMNEQIILFFYVDNIIMLYHPDYQDEFEKLE